jgi:hypothetical protein
MKSIILSFGFSLIVFNAISQEFKAPKFSKQKYIQKKRVFNIIGYGLLGTGAFLYIRGSVLAKKQRNANPNGLLNLDGLSEQIVGGISGLASVPFFLVVAHYKNKAVSLSVNNEHNFMLQQNALVKTTQPTFTLKFNF